MALDGGTVNQVSALERGIKCAKDNLKPYISTPTKHA